MNWDSKFFGFPVFDLSCSNCDARNLRILLDELREDQGRLVYWAVDPADAVSNKAAKEIHAKLVDVKTTLSLGLIEEDEKSTCTHIFECTDPSSFELQELESLALQCGQYSRFNMDPEIPTERFQQMYFAWIRKSIDHKLADVVFIFREHDQIQGFVTLVYLNDHGNIGLLAVDEKSRGKRIGFELCSVVKKKLWRNGQKSVCVTTQLKNTGAIKFYEKFGFKRIRMMNIYHIWL